MITYFADEKDETEIFKEYVFGFQSGGALRLSKGSESYSGTWGQVSSSGKTLINLRISAAGLVQRLAGDWEIISVTDDALQLSDPNGGNNKVMHLARR